MKSLLSIFLTFSTFCMIAQDSRDFYGSTTYFEIESLNDSILELNRTSDLVLDSKSSVLTLLINDSLVKFSNKLDKSDSSPFSQGTYSIRVKTKGYHFECLDQPNYLHVLDNLKLTDIRGNQIRIKAKYNIHEVKKKRNKLLSSEDVVVKINKGDLNGVLLGIKYTYDPKENIKKDKRKDFFKAAGIAVVSVAAGGAVFLFRATLFPSIF